MKSLLLIAAACVLGLGFAVPHLGGACDGRIGPEAEAGTAVHLDSASAAPAQLVVESGPRTRADRGLLAGERVPTAVRGAYRYQQEVEHRALYVYDEVQNLLVRVVDPSTVRRLDVRP